jgi:hypothetical protein
MVRVLARPAQMNPRASAPAFIAKRASSADAMQQTLIRVLIPLESDMAVSRVSGLVRPEAARGPMLLSKLGGS